MGHDVTIDGDLVSKRYESFARDEHRRESDGLRLLQRYAPGLAPVLISAALSERPPMVTMSRLPGRALTVADLAGPVRTALSTALQRMHRGVPAAVAACQPWSLGAAEVMLPRIRRMCSEHRPHPVVRDWLADLDPLAIGTDRAVFGRGDHNLENFLLDGDVVRLIDFEDSGRIDRIMELAQLIEHASTAEVPESTWTRFLAEQRLDRNERVRLAQCRRLMAVFWLQLKAGTAAAVYFQDRALRLIRTAV